MSPNNSRRVRPPCWHAGARVALIAPAGPLDEERIELSLDRARSLGLEPILGNAARNRKAYLAGTDAERASDLQRAFHDDTIDGIWALRGGYGTVRLLEHVDLSLVCEKPKAYLGFSDNTTIHLALFKAGLVSFHGPHAGGDFPPETRTALERVLFQDQAPGMLPLRDADPQPATIRDGHARGPLVGGNLSLLAAAAGTDHGLQAQGCIVFIEDVSEPAYRIDRMLMQLVRSGSLDGAAGFAFGRFTESPDDESSSSINDVLCEVADRLRVPAVIDFPIGHVDHNWTLPLGVVAELDASAATLSITESAVR